MESFSSFYYKRFLANFPYEPTPCQDKMLRTVAQFITGDEGDILVINGYAGTGKTSAIAAVSSAIKELEERSGLDGSFVLLAPTGRSAKVLSSYTGEPASTIHRHIYRQKSHTDEGLGKFTLFSNRKSRNILYIVDEVSLIGIAESGESAFFGSGNLLDDLVSFVRDGENCRLILMGDDAQLPPVGLEASPALHLDYMEKRFGGVQYTSLTTVVRQKQESGILENATRLREIITSYEDEPLEPGELHLITQGYQDVERITGGDLIETLTDAMYRYGDDALVVCRSNKRAVRYNNGIRAQVQFKEDTLVRDDRLMVVKNCYHFVEGLEGIDFIANGDIVKLVRMGRFQELYGLHFADATLSLPDYGDQEFTAKILLDTLQSESPSLTREQSNRLYQGVDEKYQHITSRKKRYDAVREDPFYNALQLKYAEAVTCHKSQGGQWKCVFIDNPFYEDFLAKEDLKWLYTALTRAVEKVYLVNFKDEYFK